MPTKVTSKKTTKPRSKKATSKAATKKTVKALSTKSTPTKTMKKAPSRKAPSRKAPSPQPLHESTADRTLYRVCKTCDHVKSLHIPKEQETRGHYGCMHEDVANGNGGAGSYCSCKGYEETIRPGYSNYTSAVAPSDIVSEG